MIDKHVFARWMATFGDRIGRKPAQPTLAAYYAALANMTTEQFEAAALHVFATHVFNTFPAPAQFWDALVPVEHVPSPHTAFERVYSIAATTSAYGKPWPVLRALIVAECGEGAAKAADGMRGRFFRHDESEVPFLRRDFLAEYELATSAEAERGRLERLPAGAVAALTGRPAPQLTRPSRTEGLERAGDLLASFATTPADD